MSTKDPAPSILTRRFEILPDAPPAWTWDEYEAWLDTAWPTLLDAGDPRDETLYQNFLEHHPCLIPGGEGTGSSFGGHHRGWGEVVISQPLLPGIRRRYPDFMWLSFTSEDIIPVLIEIEAPGKRWFTTKDHRSAALTQALDQLIDWRIAFENPASRLQIAELYDFPQSWTLRYNLEPRLLLIYGRRAEFDDRPDLNLRRRGTRGEITDAMTFDRLRPLAGSRNAVCIRVSAQEAKVLAVPPTFRLGPENAETIATYSGWSDAVESNELISAERRRFLLERLPYWAELGHQRKAGQPLGPTSRADWE